MLRETLRRLIVRDVVTRDVVTVAADASVTDLMERFWRNHFTSLPVVADGRVEGVVVVVHDVRDVAAERRHDTHVREVMRPLHEALVVGQGDTLVQALEAASNGLGRVAVLESGRLVGYLSLKDITHVLVLKGFTPGRAGATDARPVRHLKPAA